MLSSLKNSFILLGITFAIRVMQAWRSGVLILKGHISYYPAPVKRLQKRFAKLVGTKHSIMFSNATGAMEAALFSLGIGPSSRVGTTALVIPSSYCPAHNLGATIEYLDIDPVSLNLDVDSLIARSPKLDALIVTHYYGMPCDMQRIMDWAKARGVVVVEDCSHAHGARFSGKSVGAWGHVGIFSLQGAKAVAAGEGAIATTDDDRVALKMAAYGHQQSYNKLKIQTQETVAEIPPFGFGRKMRAHPVGAVLAEVDLAFLSIKNRIFGSWIKLLEKKSSPKSTFFVQRGPIGAQAGGYCQGVALRCSTKERTDSFVSKAKKLGVGHFQRDYREHLKYYADADLSSLPHAVKAFDTVVYVPFQQFTLPWKWSRLLKALLSSEA